MAQWGFAAQESPASCPAARELVPRLEWERLEQCAWAMVAAIPAAPLAQSWPEPRQVSEVRSSCRHSTAASGDRTSPSATAVAHPMEALAPVRFLAMGGLAD